MRLLDWILVVGGLSWAWLVTYYFAPWIRLFRLRGVIREAIAQMDAYQAKDERRRCELQRRSRR